MLYWFCLLQCKLLQLHLYMTLLVYSYSLHINHSCAPLDRINIGFGIQFSVLQIKCPLGGSSEKSSHVYFLLIVTMVLLL